MTISPAASRAGSVGGTAPPPELLLLGLAGIGDRRRHRATIAGSSAMAPCASHCICGFTSPSMQITTAADPPASFASFRSRCLLTNHFRTAGGSILMMRTSRSTWAQTGGSALAVGGG